MLSPTERTATLTRKGNIMRTESDRGITIRRISIRNYKGIDNLEMNFPPPRLQNAPDIFVMGSRNGLGKTSILECCALLLIGPTLRKRSLTLTERGSMVNVPDLLIRANTDSAEITGDIQFGNELVTLQITIRRSGRMKVSGSIPTRGLLKEGKVRRESGVYSLLTLICGFSPNPVLENTFMLFHSYRKVQEGNPEMGMMIDRDVNRRGYRIRPWDRIPLSEFKLQMLRALMGRAKLFEFEKDEHSKDIIKTLNKLVETYAGGTISKLRPAADNTIDFRVNPVNGGASFTFDGLSSGQKEMISTLFLIYYHTRNRSSVVLIDEPELHLNAQWHRKFVRNLFDIAPQNQYIIATHSEDVMDSVSEGRRVLLLDA